MHAITIASAFLTFTGAADPSVMQPGRGLVEVRDNRLFRDGHPWVPHGFYQIAFEVAPGDLPRAFHQFWATAQRHYSPEEYAEMRAAGADMVRLQIAQSGADPRSPLFDPAFFEKALGAVRAARDAGLTVIVCVQSETHVPKEVPIPLPDDGTRRVWSIIAPRFADDTGVLYELFNEPHPDPSPRNWAAWRAAMVRTLATVRARAKNVVVVDGLGTGQYLDGAPLLDDPQVAYASHPYAFRKYGQSRAAWDAKFGEFSRRAPVIITEWQFGAFYCDDDTADATLRFLRYIQERDIGVAVGIWDWAPATTGSVRFGFPDAKLSSFAGLACHQPGFGPGRAIQRWYTTGDIDVAETTLRDSTPHPNTKDEDVL